eukprot:gene240-291_t
MDSLDLASLRLDERGDIEIVSTREQGRFVLAKRAFKAGEVVLTADRGNCFGFVPYQIKQVCYNCFAFNDASPAAQKKSNARAPYTPYELSLLVGDHQKFNKEGTKLLRKMTAVVKKAFIVAMYDVADRDIMELFAKAERNCFGLWKNSEEGLGIIMYISASFFNHNCFPNLARVQRGRSIDIVALKDIEVDEEMCISYINVKMETAARRCTLADCYYFICRCQRCTKTNDSIENTITSYTCKNQQYATFVEKRKVVLDQIDK